MMKWSTVHRPEENTKKKRTSVSNSPIGKQDSSVHSLIRMQHTRGNQFVQRLLAKPNGEAIEIQKKANATIQRQADPGKFPDVPKLALALEKNIGENLEKNRHHIDRAVMLHPDDPQLLKDTVSRYALGLNTLETSYRWAGAGKSSAKKLALGTAVLYKGATLATKGELTLDYQLDIGKGLRLELNIAIAKGKKPEETQVGVGIGIVGRF